MELSQLRYFEAVARLGNVTKAAHEQHIAQPSLSKALRALEQELGVHLFDRVGRGVELSDAGKLLLPYARRVLAELQAARHALQSRADLTVGHVSLGVTPTVGTRLIPQALAAFNRRYRGIQLELHEAGASELVELLNAGVVDLAIVSALVHGVESTTLMSEPLVVAVGLQHRFAQRQSIAANELRDEGFILFPQGYELRNYTLQLCEQAGFAPRIVLDGGEMDTVVSLVAAGLGVAVVPQLAIDQRMGLHALMIDAGGLQRTLRLIRHSQRQPSPAAAALHRVLHEWVSQHYPSASAN
ncbi:MAG TPA: LysR family transcriptional regulator [Herpetosiphon sp.]|uniref:Transcriptional regulator, LysR family n=1 Tax=Herpetosiphon aurantiacus (strain ATCC 23779 / DSM 785 / 114-95) TaxID=316274 RepID=A9B3V4_HERA2|nr:LysR substrate-binding domain-containing protein [Herpetosiphon sp.]ABX06090.1 transcriptional regulator, LysR family [Herpetosiphon aurantiacus DSM 785]HBW50134.1 LysR family transcriptional regulator [Herpetosiphon sp.]